MKLLRRAAAVLLVLFLLYALAFAYFFFFTPTAEDYAHRVAFDSAGWQRHALDDDPEWPTRLRMVDDLVADRRLDGLTRSEVESLLGSADQTAKWKDWELVYYLGPERNGIFRIDSEWLVIRFDLAGRVSEYRIVSD